MSHTFWVQDLSADHLVVVWPFKGIGWGLETSLEQAQGVDERDAAGQWLGTGSVQRPGASLDANRRWGGLSLGLRASMDNVDLPGQSPQWGAGAGAVWTRGPLRLGAALDGLPTSIDWRFAAFLSNGADQRWVLAAGYLGDGIDARWGGGVQWKPLLPLALRAGWQLPRYPLPGSWGQGSLGLAVTLASGVLSYTWLNEGDLGQVHRVQWMTGLGLAEAAAPVTPLATATPTASFTPSVTPTPYPLATATPSLRPAAVVVVRTVQVTPRPATPSNPVNLRFVIP